MGLFDFMKDKGEKVIKSDDGAADIKARIEADNPGIADLNVEYWTDGLVRLSGTAESAEAKEKAVLIAGNDMR